MLKSSFGRNFKESTFWSRVEGEKSRVHSRVKSRGSRVKGQRSEKYGITLRIIFSCVYTDSSQFLAMFNDLLTSVYYTYPYTRTQIYQIVTETKLV